MKKHLQNGFGHLGLILLLAVVAAIAAIGYKVVNDNADTNEPNVTASAQVIKSVKSTADLDEVKSTLNKIDLDNDLNPSALDQDINSLL